MASHNFESDSGEQASSTTDEVESSRGDFDEEDSEKGSTTGTDSNNENGKSFTPREHRKYTDNRFKATNKTNVQSDTETKNLLDDVGEDADDDYLNLQEEDNLSNITGPMELDAKLFELSDEQLNYYTNCFLFLLEKTQGFTSLSGALQGLDPAILDFFRKSRLDDLTLSKIWSQSDLNEDGFLNHSEFVTAMHLIILHTKGNVPVPNRLPPSARPPLTPARTLFQLEDGLPGNNIPDSQVDLTSDSSTKITGECISSSSGNSQVLILQERINKVGGRSLTDGKGANGNKHHSFSDDHLHSTQRGVASAKLFTDVPPLLVDCKPTALDAATSSQVLPEFAQLLVSSTRGPPPQPPYRDYSNNGCSKGHGRSISLDLKTFSALSTTFPNQRNYSGESTGDPSNKIDASPIDKSVQTTGTFSTSIGTQTRDCKSVAECEAEIAMCVADMGAKLGAKERCEMLQRINEQLEAERVTLMQVRLQVQLRIDETEQGTRSSASPKVATKPSNL